MSKPKLLSTIGLAAGIVSEERSLSSLVRKVLEAEGWTIAFMVSPAELDNTRTLEADVVVACGSLDGNGTSAVARARHAFPDLPIVACAQAEEGRPIRRLVDSGVDGIVWNSRLDRTLGATAIAVHAGQLVLPQDARVRLQPPDLTNREKQTLSLVIMGLTNREIADKLYVSESTVKSHLNTAYRKLGVHSRNEAVRRIADPAEGYGTGILAITDRGLARGRQPKSD